MDHSLILSEAIRIRDVTPHVTGWDTVSIADNEHIPRDKPQLAEHHIGCFPAYAAGVASGAWRAGVAARTRSTRTTVNTTVSWPSLRHSPAMGGKTKESPGLRVVSSPAEDLR